MARTSLNLITRGRLDRGGLPTLNMITRAYLREGLVDIPVFPPAPPGGGASGPARRRQIDDLREKMKDKEFIEFLRREDEEILIIIKAFLKCQE